MTGAYEGSFNGYTFGNRTRPGASVRSLTGFGSVRATAVVSESPNGGGNVGQAAKGPKQIALGLNLHATTPAELQAVSDDVVAAFDPGAGEQPLVIGGRMMFATALEVDPQRDPSWAGDEHSSPCDIVLQAGDPAVYSPTETDLPFGGDTPVDEIDLAFTNLGHAQTRHWHSWRLRITAHGTVTSPYIRLLGTDQIVTWLGLSIPAGRVLTVGAFRTSRVGELRVDGFRRSGASEFPDHPVLPPGPSTIRIGCASGLISGNFYARSVYA